MATSHPRVQVTVDPELAAALNAVHAHPRSKSRLIRDMALRGARSIEADRGWAHQQLMKIASGEIDYDFEALREFLETPDEHLG